MDPATITALSIGITSFVSIVAAGIVACCRKNKNVADKNNKDSAAGDIIIEVRGEEKEITTTTTIETVNGNQQSTTVTVTKTKQPPIINFSASAVNTNLDAFNHTVNEEGYNKPPISILNPATGSAINGEASAASSSAPPVSSLSSGVTTESPISSLPASNALSSVNRAFIKKTVVQSGELKIEFGGIRSYNTTGVIGAAPNGTKQTIALTNEDEEMVIDPNLLQSHPTMAVGEIGHHESDA